MRVKSHINTLVNPLIANNSVGYSARDKRTDLCMIDKLGGITRMAHDTTVTIHGSAWKRADIEDAVADCRSNQWHRQQWVCRDALVQRTGTTSLYVGQRYDPAFYELVRGGWRHDHCEVCWWTLSEGGDEEHSVGFTDGQRWVCSECYHQFIETTDETHAAS